MLKSVITPRCSLFAAASLGSTELGMYLHFGSTDPKPHPIIYNVDQPSHGHVAAYSCDGAGILASKFRCPVERHEALRVLHRGFH